MSVASGINWNVFFMDRHFLKFSMCTCTLKNNKYMYNKQFLKGGYILYTK